MPATGFHPCVAMRSEGEEARVVTDLHWDSHDDVSMCIDNVEDEWARLHDVRLNGQVSLNDVTLNYSMSLNDRLNG